MYHYNTALKVDVQVDYVTPSDFSLPSPPYYRPASSVTLSCVAHSAIGNATYRWTSTEQNSFFHGGTEQNMSQNILTAFDSGIHTCTVTDELGNTGSDHTEMKLFGVYNLKQFKYTICLRAHHIIFIFFHRCRNLCST